ncbi:MAG: aminotransferase class V-fold PLP-dependent enzyme [Candidatus Marinimicrobia bacterium]|nr:aminotransferase class V-fold PLP-dependent enzyme [Candidatus Neomarinimicrobiota bacterium]
MRQVDRREFLGAVMKPAAAAWTVAMLNPAGMSRALGAVAGMRGRPEDIARDESFWFEIQQAYTADRSLVNLNNGGVSPAPAVVQEAMKRHLDYSNTAPVYSMWKILEPQREPVRKRLARFFGCDAEEIALTRNASEGLQISQNGFDLEEGDEVLTTTQDYGRMINTFKQRECRDGIVMKQFVIPVPAEDDNEIIRLFEQNITPKTKLILMCHMINLTGQILPVKKVVQMARRRDIPVIVDGAHTFAHFDFTHADLDCDYYATSLHKWLCAPIGTGMLYVRRDKIAELWPLQAPSECGMDDIRKYEEIGTHPAANYIAIGDALTFQQGIGSKNKGARLIYLRDRWAKRLLKHDRIRLHTSLKSGKGCGIGTVQIEGVDPSDLTKHLWDDYRIIVTPIKHDEFEGIRVTPHVYTTLEEIDRFADAMEKVIKEGIG